MKAQVAAAQPCVGCGEVNAVINQHRIAARSRAAFSSRHLRRFRGDPDIPILKQAKAEYAKLIAEARTR